MTREQLIQALADRVDVPAHSAQVFLHACFDIIKSQLRDGESVVLPLLGKWTPIRDSEGALNGVGYAALADESGRNGEVLHGPASSIDARHFIPAAALDSRNGGMRTPVDIASIVREVRTAFSPEPETPPAEGANSVASPVPDAASDTASSETARMEDFPVTAPMTASTVIEESGSEEDILLEAEIEAEQYAGELLSEEYAGEATDDADHALTAEDYSLALADPSDIADDEPLYGEAPGEVEEEAPDPLADDEVFNRNRDQLYNPPAETSKRPLLITAAILTLCVLIIIVYILLDHSAPRDLPGSEPVGQRAAAGAYNFDC